MIAQNLISQRLEVLTTKDNGFSALNRMMKNDVEEFPVVNQEGAYLGMLLKIEVEDHPQKTMLISDFELENQQAFVRPNDHLFDVVKKMLDLSCHTLAVIEPDGQFLGIINIKDVIDNLRQYNVFTDPGGVIILEMNDYDYSLIKIAQIVESNNASILASMVHSLPNSKRISVTLKLNHIDLSHVVATFERYDYEVYASFQENESNDYLQERLESLMAYLNV